MTRPAFTPFILKLLSIGSFMIAVASIWLISQEQPLLPKQEQVTINIASKTKTPASLSKPKFDKTTQTPDERILWQLFNSNKLTLLQSTISQWQKQFPKWSPPIQLLTLIHKKQPPSSIANRQPIGHAWNPLLLNSDINQVISLVLSQPSQHCDQLQQLWSGKNIYHYLDSQADKLNLLTAAIHRCKSGKDRLNLVQSAQSYLDITHFNRLIQSIQPLFHKAKDIQRIANIHYRYNRYSLSQSITKHNISIIEQLLPQLTSAIKQRKDVAIANQLGWYFFKQNRTISINWFSAALTWQPRHLDSAIGLVQALYDNHQNTQALDLARHFSDHPRMQPLLASLLLAQAQELYDQHDYQNSLNVLQQARLYLADPRPADELNAWLLWQMSDLQKALQLAKRYQPQSKGMRELTGLIYYKKAWQQMDQKHYTQAEASLNLAQSYSGETPEGNELKAWLDYKQSPKKYSFPELFAYKEFLAAKQYAPAPSIAASITPSAHLLQNIDSTFIETGILYRSRSGSAGTSRLEIKELPLIGSRYVFSNTHEFSIHGFRSELYSGQVSKQDCRSIGSIGLVANNTQMKPCFSPFKNSLSNGLYAQINYQHAGKFNPYFSIGSTPMNGILGPSITWNIGFKQHGDHGFWQLEGFSNPVRQSILSYTGMQDPYSHEKWGRVMSTGLLATTLIQLNQDWSLYSESKGAFLGGTKVANNLNLSQSISLAYNFYFKHFDYFSLGPHASIQHYKKNLSHFTLGHGGYFSPQLLYNIGASLNFLTKEGKPFILKGQASAGFQSFTEEQSLYFPTNSTLQSLAEQNLQNQGIYSKNSQLGAAFDLELKGAWLLTPNIQIAGGGGFQQIGNYSDYFFAANIRYYFKGRVATFSTDIPRFTFKQLF